MNDRADSPEQIQSIPAGAPSASRIPAVSTGAIHPHKPPRGRKCAVSQRPLQILIINTKDEWPPDSRHVHRLFYLEQKEVPAPLYQVAANRSLWEEPEPSFHMIQHIHTVFLERHKFSKSRNAKF